MDVLLQTMKKECECVHNDNTRVPSGVRRDGLSTAVRISTLRFVNMFLLLLRCEWRRTLEWETRHVITPHTTLKSIVLCRKTKIIIQSCQMKYRTSLSLRWVVMSDRRTRKSVHLYTFTVEWWIKQARERKLPIFFRLRLPSLYPPFLLFSSPYNNDNERITNSLLNVEYV